MSLLLDLGGVPPDSLQKLVEALDKAVLHNEDIILEQEKLHDELVEIRDAVAANIAAAPELEATIIVVDLTQYT